MTKIARHALSAVAVLACAMGVSAPANAVLRRQDLQRPPVHRRRRRHRPGQRRPATRSPPDGRDQLRDRGVRLHARGQHLAEQADDRQRDRAAARPDVHGDVDGPPATSSSTPRIPISSRAAGSLLTLGGTNSGGSGSRQGRAWGGTSNTAFQFSGANLLSSLGPLHGPSFSASASNVFAPAVNPYSLTIGTTVSRATAGTSTGDLNLQVSAIPEPSTWASILMGAALVGFVARRRRRR